MLLRVLVVFLVCHRGVYNGPINVSVWQPEERKGQTAETNSEKLKALISETAAGKYKAEYFAGVRSHNRKE
jgi:hypothetical protein